MSTITEIFDSAELSLASYADLVTTLGISQQITKLKEAGMSQKQAEEFAVRFTEVITISDDPLDTGFSATVFASPTGQLTLAIRGTDEFPGIDYGDDLDILNSGLAKEQLLVMVNWWSKISNPTGTSVKQFSIQSYREGIDTVPSGATFVSRTEGSGLVPIATNNYLIRSADAVATGELTAALAADSNHKLAVTG